jgi:hypothetical protein
MLANFLVYKGELVELYAFIIYVKGREVALTKMRLFPNLLTWPALFYSILNPYYTMPLSQLLKNYGSKLRVHASKEAIV